MFLLPVLFYSHNTPWFLKSPLACVWFSPTLTWMHGQPHTPARCVFCCSLSINLSPDWHGWEHHRSTNTSDCPRICLWQNKKVWIRSPFLIDLDTATSLAATKNQIPKLIYIKKSNQTNEQKHPIKQLINFSSDLDPRNKTKKRTNQESGKRRTQRGNNLQMTPPVLPHPQTTLGKHLRHPKPEPPGSGIVLRRG